MAKVAKYAGKVQDCVEKNGVWLNVETAHLAEKYDSSLKISGACKSWCHGHIKKRWYR